MYAIGLQGYEKEARPGLIIKEKLSWFRTKLFTCCKLIIYYNLLKKENIPLAVIQFLPAMWKF